MKNHYSTLRKNAKLIQKDVVSEPKQDLSALRKTAPDPAAVGIYKRGNVYWYRLRKNGIRSFVTLETSDFLEAITRAKALRVSPELNTGGTIAGEVEKFLAYKIKTGDFRRQTEGTSRSFLKRLVTQAGTKSPGDYTTLEATKFYRDTRELMKESSARTYVAHARSFFQWCVA